MKAKAYLKQIEKMEAKKKILDDELEKLETLATRTTSVLGGERVQTSGNKDKIADFAVKISDMRQRINEEIVKIAEYRQDALNVIFECETDCIKLLYEKYVKYKGWEEIAFEMSYTYQWVSGGLHQKALGQVQKVLDEREEAKNEQH